MYNYYSNKPIMEPENISIIIYEYNNYIRIINLLQHHIFICYEKNIIGCDIKNYYFELLNSTIVQLNLLYNIHVLKTVKQNDTSLVEEKKLREKLMNINHSVNSINSSLNESHHTSSLNDSSDDTSYDTSCDTSYDTMNLTQSDHTNFIKNDKFSKNTQINKVNKSFPNVHLSEHFMSNHFPPNNLLGRYTSTELIIDMDDLNKMLDIKHIDTFKSVNKFLLNKICKNVGFDSVGTCLNLLFGHDYRYLFNNIVHQQINMYNKIFVPIKYSIYKKSSNDYKECYNIIIKKNIDNELNDNEIIIKYLDLYLMCPNKTLKFTGYFKTDYLNVVVRSSRLCSNFIYQKKKLVDKYLLDKNIFCKNFYLNYIKCLSLYDILISDVSEIYDDMISDHNLYDELDKSSLSNIFEKFNQGNSSCHQKNKQIISNMYRIIKVLLVGSSSLNKIGSILFNSINSNYVVSSQIYNNLHYLLQKKLLYTGKQISNEIDNITKSNDSVDFKLQIIINDKIPMYVKKILFNKLDNLNSDNNDYSKQILYLRSVINFPWTSDIRNTTFTGIKDKKKFLSLMMENLDKKVHGHIDCKKSIKEIIGKMLSNTYSTSTAIGLYGPPGVGKTLIAKSVSETLDIPFIQITLGGQNDSSLLDGHYFTYVSSQPGMIITKMTQYKKSQCIIYFDELDKTSERNNSNDIYNIIMGIIDPMTNKEFQDKFFPEIKFPLNEVLFIFSYNNPNKIDSVLLDRITEIEIKPFRTIEKVDITNRFIVKELCKLLNFNYQNIFITDEIITHIIDSYTNEPGVRELKKMVNSLFMKLNIDKINDHNSYSYSTVINIDMKMVTSYLGHSPMTKQITHSCHSVGIINGLYVSENYVGGIMQIQISDNYANYGGDFMLVFTGNQKRLMRESVITAFNTAISCIEKKILNLFMKNNSNGLHIHTLRGSVPKDGTSAGTAFAIAFISKILNKKIKNDLAMTGEIDLTGTITKISRLEIKLIGAKKAGIKQVIISEQNKYDVDNIKKENPYLLDNTFSVISLNNIREALPYALIDFDSSVII